MRLTAAAYRLLLRAFPAEVRREFGGDMAAMFARQVEEARRERRSVSRLWWRAATDAAVNGVGARLVSPKPAASYMRATADGTKPPGSRTRWWVHAFLQDFRYAIRVLGVSPASRSSPCSRSRSASARTPRSSPP